MDFSSFWTSLGTSFLIFVVLMLLYTWLSRKPEYAMVYYPNRILKDMEPWEGGSRTRNPFVWIQEALSSSEQDVIAMSGVDTAVYFVFLNTVLGILVLSGLVLLPVLLPVAATNHAVKATNSSSRSFIDPTKLSMENIEVNKIWEELEGYRKKLALAEAIYAKSKSTGKPERARLINRTGFLGLFGKKVDSKESKSTGKPEGARPTKRTGFLGLFGKKVDSIEYYNKKIHELIPKLESEQKVTLREKQQGAALVFFTSRLTAASAAQSLHSQLANNWTVISAPEPRQLIWNNLKIKFFQRKVRHHVAYICAALSIIPFYKILFLLLHGIASLRKLENLRVIKKLLEALSPIAIRLFLALIRKLLLLLSEAEGIPSKSHAVRAASGKYFYLHVLGSFIPLLLSDIVKETSGRDLLQEDILQEYTTFFMVYVPYQAFVSSGLELSRLLTLIPYHLETKYWYNTEAQRKEACSPGDLDYGTRVPDDMLILTLVLCYSVVAPLLILVGVAYFGLAWLVLRNQALKVYVPSYESYGRMWPHIHKRIVAFLVLCQVTMLCFLGARQLSYILILIPLPMLSLLFGYTCSNKFYSFFCDTALEVACRPLNEVPNMDQVFKAFIPPSLHSEKIDDD